MNSTIDKPKMLSRKKIEVNLEGCTKCGMCVAECPQRLYYFRDDSLVIRRSFDMLCMECGHCVAVCPINNIKLKRYSSEEIRTLSEDYILPDYNEVLNLIQFRRSVRQFKEEPISEDLWKKLIEAGRYAPTGHNDQLIYYTVVRDKAVLNKISEEMTNGFIKLSDIFKDPNKRDQFDSRVPKAYLNIVKATLVGLPAMLKGIARGEEFWRWKGELLIIHAPKQTFTLEQDCSLAACNIMLASSTLGLGTCSLGLLTVGINMFESLAKIIELPKKHRVGYALAVGLPKVKYYRTAPRRTARVSWL